MTDAINERAVKTIVPRVFPRTMNVLTKTCSELIVFLVIGAGRPGGVGAWGFPMTLRRCPGYLCTVEPAQSRGLAVSPFNEARKH
jgi:hypothetical protein